ncbi:hypothetical protein O4H52_16420 [Sphingomonadaceae bacterium G21617-S1]|uniref:hypothetical protein n=1 Tax=Rhizorhabdus sp. TaxID=1968843 RepID=UPI0022C6C756|nr:hypothetical protein [Rhizorhabdus sp.]MCZ4343203.1 hypothetical protein [Sphingomonadaceae bacterium G21617-S1]
MTAKTTPPAPDNSAELSGHMAEMSDILIAQARELNMIFTAMTGQTKKNLANWPGIARSYAHLAIRAQANCRASLEAVARVERAARTGRDDDAD